MEALAVVVQEPRQLSLNRLPITPPGASDIVVDTKWSGISSGTERLLWSGRMPPFPGMGYPLVPGYESVGEVIEAGPEADKRPGETVFVPGAQCYGPVRGLFGGAASRLVTASSRAICIDPSHSEHGVLLALAATAQHAIAGRSRDAGLPELIVGHGVLGRLLARLTLALGGKAPTVWETEPLRRKSATAYRVCHPDDDERRNYASIYDVSGDAGLIDSLIACLAPGGEIVLAGFYEDRPSFAFPPAFMREARIRIAAEWRPEDLHAVKARIEAGELSIDDLITHRAPVSQALSAYRNAFENPDCLKMVLEWSASS